MNVPLRRYRKGLGHSYAFGLSATLELLRRQPEAALGVVASPRCRRSPVAQRIRQACHRLGLEFRLDESALDRLGCKESCVLVGVFRPYNSHLDPIANHLVLHQPQYAGNLGTIVRTMLGFGFDDLAVIQPGSQILDPQCVRASMGAVFAVRFEYFQSLDAYRQAHPRTIHPFVVQGGQDLAHVAFRQPLSLLFGSEGGGLPEAACRCGPCVCIPHRQTIDSLGISVAVGISLYEVSRRLDVGATGRV